MTRIADLEAEIEALKDRRAAIEFEAERANDLIMEAALQAIDALSNKIAALRRELDELNDMASMREAAHDRVYGRWQTS